MSIWLVLGGLIVFLLLWFGPQLFQKIKRRTVELDTRLPHERYPRILNWRKGDRFETRDRVYWPNFYAGQAKLIGLTPDGRVFLEDSKQKWNLSVDDVCSNCWNLDASNREISEKIQASKGYTEALSAFNKSVQALQSRDEENGVDLPDKYYPQVPADLYL